MCDMYDMEKFEFSEELYDRLSKTAPGEKKAPLSRYATFRVGGPAAYLAKPQDTDQLKRVLQCCKAYRAPYFVVGAGSNLLFADQGLNAVVIYTGELNRTTVSGQEIYADAGVPLMKLCREAAKHGLSGLEFAYGIPGSVGGGVFMNAGAYGGELSQAVKQVLFLDENGEECLLSLDECEFAYRKSVFQRKKGVILGAVFSFAPDTPQAIQARMREYMERRKSKQPLEYPSAGSFFKRPAGAFAGALIEQCGCKGLSSGGAQVSEKHAGFLINRENATCHDVCALARRVSHIVREQTGFVLEPEVRLIGRDWED